MKPKDHTRRSRQRNLFDSPFPGLLQSNNVVTDEEYQVVATAIARVQEELDYLQEIDKIEGETQATYHQRLACEDFIDKHQALLHWTRRLPNELLFDIFSWCTDENTIVPFYVSHVCRRWRYVALSAPKLWRKIPVRGRFVDVAAGRRFVAFLSQEYLLRSRDEPITSFWHPWSEVADELYDVLAQHVDRWGDVQLALDQQWDERLPERLEDLKGRLGSLYALKLSIMPNSDEVDLTPFAMAHRLKYLEYNDIRNRLSHGTEHLDTDWPWLSLTHFSGSFHRMDCIDPVLFYFKNLVYIHLKWTDWRLPAGGPIPDTVRAESCKYLHLEIHLPTYIWSRHNPITFLAFVEFPSLEGLAITYIMKQWQDSDAVLQLLAAFVHKHGKHLESFHWNSYVHKYSSYNDRNGYYPPIVNDLNLERLVFDTLSNLRTLRITSPSCNTLEDILRSLRLDRNFLPRLQRLDLRIRPQAMMHKDLTSLCELLRKFVRLNEMFPPASLARRDISKIRLQVAEPIHTYPGSISPWDIVVKLDEWEEKLRVDTLPPTASGSAQPLPSLDSSASSGPSSQPLQIDPPVDLVFSHQETRLQRFFIKYLHYRLVGANRWYSHQFQEPVDVTLARWTRMFREKASSRRWTTAGEDSVIYVPPDSPLRKDDTLWVFGVCDYDPKDLGYLDKDSVPHINPRWRISEDMVKYGPHHIEGL